ncbi:hypothetical protein [Curtobacterium sp. TXMA1]|uniref:hypothetical protein n=1 Tax=Curtobacterium sp. TXMA1 TaxID=2876939 RepID=UPI001CCA4A97|nr:hypothetical protein [Curtobacterium sp. TXMA1]UBQ03294.1 hypothetical protein LCG91_03735 [Curtobacterium sp. TXMA1]
MRITQRAAKSGAFVLVLAGLGGAVLHSLPEPADHAVRPTVERDTDTWSMPLDGYVQPPADETSYAEELVAGPCLERLGIDGTPPWATVSGLQAVSEADDPAVRGNTAPALATTKPLLPALVERRGYHASSTIGANVAARRSWAGSPDRAAAIAAAPGKAVDACWRRAREALGTDGRRVEQATEVAERLTFLAAVDARRDPSVTATTGAWHRCMGTAGLVDLPAAPSDLPSQSMLMDHGLSFREGEVTKAEIALAEQDLSCQETSGYRAALYDAQWSRLLHVTATDAAALAAARPDQLAVAERVATTIEQLAPEAPEGVD